MKNNILLIVALVFLAGRGQLSAQCQPSCVLTPACPQITDEYRQPINQIIRLKLFNTPGNWTNTCSNFKIQKAWVWLYTENNSGMIFPSFPENDIKMNVTGVFDLIEGKYLPEFPGGGNYGRTVQFSMAGGHSYRVDVKFEYKKKKRYPSVKYESITKTSCLYYCMGDLYVAQSGGLGITFNAPQVTQCVSKTLSIADYNFSEGNGNTRFGTGKLSDNYEFYWGKDPANITTASPKGMSYEVKESGTYYVKAYHPQTGVWSADYKSTGEIILDQKPLSPTLTAKTICDCDSLPIQLTGTAGTNGNTLRWTYNNTVSTGTTFSLTSYPSTPIYVESYNTGSACHSEKVEYPINVVSCGACQNGFFPEPGGYVVSGWVKEGNGEYSDPAYGQSYIEVVLNGTTSIKFKASGPIIEGWQKIEGEFTVPSASSSLEINMGNASVTPYQFVFFDDIRVQPFNSSMVTYVYDPDKMRLVAQLDENNFATYYIYDEEGNAVKTKQETIKGIKTVSESRSNVVRKN